MPDNDFQFELGLGTSGWDRSIDKAKRDAGQFEGDLKDLEKAANNMESAVNDIDANIALKANVDDADLRTAKGLHDELDTNTSFNADVGSDSDLTAAKRKHDDLEQNTSFNANVGDDKDLDKVIDKLETIQGLATVDILLNAPALAGGALEILQNIPGLSGVLEYDEALGRLEGRTGRMIPGARTLIEDLYTNAWGDSRSAIADVIAEAANLGIANEDIAEVVQAAYFVTDVTGGEAMETIRTMDTLVKTGLTPTYEAAADLLVTGFQTGADRGQDLLDTFDEYGTKLGTLKISGPGALNLINSALKNGVKDSDFLVDSINELGLNLAAIHTDESIQQAFTDLDNLTSIDLAGLLASYEAGEISGDEFFDGFFAGLGEATAADPSKANEAAVKLIGTKYEDLGAEAFDGLTTKGDATFTSIEGRAEEASTTINNNLSTLTTGVVRTVDEELTNLIRDTVDVDGIINDIKTRLATFSAELKNGEGIVDAAGIALDIDPETIHRLESIFVNLGITFATAIAGALDIVGQGDAAQSIRDLIAPQVQTQFVFDAKLANDGAELERAIKNAAARGMEDQEIVDGLRQSLDELLAEGDIPGAEQFAANVNEAIQNSTSDVLTDFRQSGGVFGILGDALSGADNADFDLSTVFKPEELNTEIEATAADMMDRFNTAINEGDFELARALAEDLNDAQLVSLVDEIEAELGYFNDSITEWADNAEVQTAGAKKAVEDFETANTRSMNAAQRELDETTAAVQRTSAAYTALKENAKGAPGAPSSGGGDSSTSGENPPAATGGMRGPGFTPVHADETVFFDESVAVLNQATTSSLFAIAERLMAEGAFSPASNNNRNTTVNQNIYVQSNAQGMSAAQQTANRVRGF